METTTLLISEQFPILGASPDGDINRICSGFDVLETKCPRKSRDVSIAEYLMQSELCLAKNYEEIFLKPKHRYQAQAQHQMFVTGSMYCDFEVFLSKQSITVRSAKDPNYEIKQAPKPAKYFDSIVLPGLFPGKIANVVACRNTLKELLYNIGSVLDNKEPEKNFEIYTKSYD